MAKALMIMGTASDVGKSVIAAGLCRLFYRRGARVAPFKAQNMSLNSFVTAEGGEMGRAQVVQAQACGLLPHVDMNPILLKPEGNNRSQVIVHGKVWGPHDARHYFARHDELFRFVEDSYQRLADAHDVIVIEGAGSAAEMNLRDKDLVNWPVAEMANADVLLVADIDRGGVFAQVIGTLDLLQPAERGRVIGIIINKFRGDASLFADGVSFLENRTLLPVSGVIPFDRTLSLDQEDSVELDRHRQTLFAREKVNIAVVLLPHMSNFTDFNALAAEPDVVLRYAATPAEIAGADVVILPGSKNTITDLDSLDQRGFRPALVAHRESGGEIVGLCGGYQMLGREISDPLAVEEGGRRCGLALLDIHTELTETKTTAQVNASPLFASAGAGLEVLGYQIHMGVSRRTNISPAFLIFSRRGQTCWMKSDDGAMTEDRCVWGTYIHGVFDTANFRRFWINRSRQRKNLPLLPTSVSQEVTNRLSSAIDRWADLLENCLDLAPIWSRIEPRTPRLAVRPGL